MSLVPYRATWLLWSHFSEFLLTDAPYCSLSSICYGNLLFSFTTQRRKFLGRPKFPEKIRNGKWLIKLLLGTLQFEYYDGLTLNLMC